MKVHEQKQGVPIGMAELQGQWHVAFVIPSITTGLPGMFLAQPFTLSQRPLRREDVMIGAGEVGEDFQAFAIPNWIGYKFQVAVHFL